MSEGRLFGLLGIFVGIGGLVMTGFVVASAAPGFLGLSFREQQLVILQSFLMMFFSLFMLAVGALKFRFPEYRVGPRRRD